MDLSGNKDLLDRRLVAFFASRKATPHYTQLALQWAADICQTDKVVISGFHSPLEKEILNYLLERHHPVIFALGRALYKKVPPHLQSAFDEGNLLFISFRDYTRHSWNSALQRNWGAADLADEIYFTQFDNTSSLSTLHFTLDRYSDKAVYILRWFQPNRYQPYFAIIQSYTHLFCPINVFRMQILFNFVWIIVILQQWVRRNHI